jgi:hypothetical protein
MVDTHTTDGETCHHTVTNWRSLLYSSSTLVTTLQQQYSEPSDVLCLQQHQFATTFTPDAAACSSGCLLLYTISKAGILPSSVTLVQHALFAVTAKTRGVDSKQGVQAPRHRHDACYPGAPGCCCNCCAADSCASSPGRSQHLMTPLTQAVKMASSVKRMSDTGSACILGVGRVRNGG